MARFRIEGGLGRFEDAASSHRHGRSMRVLFVTWAWPSHLHALTPLAQACAAAGHDVRVASQPSLAATAARSRLPFVSVGYNIDAVASFRELLLGRGRRASPARAPTRPRALAVFAAAARAMTGELIGWAASWQPDVVVCEPTALAGPIVAKALGIPALRQLYGLDLMSRFADALRDTCDEVGRGYGVPEADPFGALTFDPCPAPMRLPGSAASRPVRYVPYSGLPVGRTALPDRAGRPRVCITFGTTMALLGREFFLVPHVIEILAGQGVQVVAAITAEQRHLLGPAAAWAHVEQDVPLTEILPECDAVIAHGGAGTVLTALGYGLPCLLLPQLPDHAAHARQVEAAGAGLVITRPDLTAHRLTGCLRALLEAPEYRSAAARLGEAMAIQPPPAELASGLAGMTASITSR
jgi:UDP:flavonoid glycosyltransferase YjiC (YdhE family)